MSDAPFEAMVSSMAEGAVAVDASLHVRLINPAAQQLFRVPALAQSAPPLLEVIRHAELHQLLERVIVTGRADTRELTLFSPEERVVRAQAVSYEDGPGRRGALVVFSDLTEIRKLERLRRDFVANVSHELRTPVTAIQAALETLQAGAAQEAQARDTFLDKIAAQANRLARLIDDLMSLSQIESGGLRFRFDAIALEPLWREVIGALQPQADRRRVTIRLLWPPDFPTVRGDRERLHQVAQNLLDNAIKFNREGGEVTISAVADARSVTLAVSDTGIGIPQDDLSRIFERFYRVEKGRARTTGGTGLGLAIVKHLVEAHAGTIRAESHPGRGSTFHITLPRSAP